MQPLLRVAFLFTFPLATHRFITPAAGPNVELGAPVGFGGAGAEDLTTRSFVNFGVELCALCKGRFAIFAEYNHWEPFEMDSSRAIKSLDAFGAGLRIQGGRRVRPFFDVGFAAATDSYTYYTGWGYPPTDGQHTNPGLVLGGGAAIHIGSRFYVRPQFRMFILRGYHYAAGGGAGVGFSF